MRPKSKINEGAIMIHGVHLELRCSLGFAVFSNVDDRGIMVFFRRNSCAHQAGIAQEWEPLMRGFPFLPQSLQVIGLFMTI